MKTCLEENVCEVIFDKKRIEYRNWKHAGFLQFSQLFSLIQYFCFFKPHIQPVNSSLSIKFQQKQSF